MARSPAAAVVIELTPEGCAALLGWPLPAPTPIPTTATCRVCSCLGTATHPLVRFLSGGIEHLYCPPVRARSKLRPCHKRRRRRR